MRLSIVAMSCKSPEDTSGCAPCEECSSASITRHETRGSSGAPDWVCGMDVPGVWSRRDLAVQQLWGMMQISHVAPVTSSSKGTQACRCMTAADWRVRRQGSLSAHVLHLPRHAVWDNMLHFLWVKKCQSAPRQPARVCPPLQPSVARTHAPCPTLRILS